VTTLTREEIARYATNAGFSGNDVQIAVAVALAESGGNTDSHNAKPPDDSYGLWQINMLGSLGPDRRKKFGITSNTALFDPAVNAKAAKIIHDGSGWDAWTTYSTGKYKQFTDKGFVDTVKAGVGEVTGVDNVAASINALGKNLFNGIASLIGISVAVGLLILGFVILLRKQVPVKKIAKTAVKVVAK
jgi:hypothetical protein